MPQSAPLQTLIRERARARRDRERAQKSLLDDNDCFHETIRTKLAGLLDSTQFWNFSRCGQEKVFRTCKSCQATEAFEYHCSLKWCPRCAYRVTATRKKLIGLWASKITQPKHLVLTQKNFPVLTRRSIREMTRNLYHMRRRKSFAAVKGGCVSVEITNEKRGWHLHSHWLLDCRWLNMTAVCSDWSSLVGQDFAIAKVKDCRNEQYLQEVSKYVVEGSELAKWPADQVNEFVRAVKGLRFFFSFGSLFKLAPEIRRELFATAPPSPVCDCGCSDFAYEDEATAICHDIERLNRRKRR